METVLPLGGISVDLITPLGFYLFTKIRSMPETSGVIGQSAEYNLN